MQDTEDRAYSGLATLTRRERDVLDHLVDGRPNKYIAIELGISQRTAEAHRARIFQKMGVRNAVQLARLLGMARYRIGAGLALLSGGLRLAEPESQPQSEPTPPSKPKGACLTARNRPRARRRCRLRGRPGPLGR